MAAFRHLLRRHLSTTVPTTSSPILYSSSFPTITPVQLLSWGRGASGQLGGGREELRLYPSPVASLHLPPSSSLSPTPGRLGPPRPIPAGSTATTSGTTGVDVGISCGLFHSAVVVDGGVWIWGKGDGGRLGFGNETSEFVPRKNPYLEGIRTVALGGIHSTALTRSGDVLTW